MSKRFQGEEEVFEKLAKEIEGFFKFLEIRMQGEVYN